MKILLITSTDIYMKSGGAFANRAFYDSLNRHYPGNVDVIQYHETGSKVKSFLRGMIHRLYYWLLDYLDERKGVYQICVINSGLFGDLVPEIKKRGIRVVTIHHNFETVYQMDSKSPVTLWGLTPWFVERNERKAYRYSDLNLFLSEYDQKVMQSHYGSSCTKIDVVVGVYETIEHSECIFNVEAIKPMTIDMAISGSMDHLQSRLGFQDFESHYYPIFKRIVPSSQLVITGRNPQKTIVDFAEKNDHVALIPNPDRISDVIKDCSIYCCPVNVGSGVKFRILDGLRLGMPILTHAVSARGYEAYANQPWFQAYHDAESFERGLRTILQYIDQHDNFRSEIVQNYKAVFSFEVGNRKFIDAISKLDECIGESH